MTGKTTWKIPDLRRAIKVARSQGLTVTSCDIGRDGSLTIHTRDHALPDAKPSDQAEDFAGEAA